MIAHRGPKREDRSMDVNINELGPFAESLGLQVTRADGDEVFATWKASVTMYQPHGIVHGGVHCSVVETLASVGASLWLGDRGRVVGVSNATDFFRAVTDGELSSVGRPIHRGRSQQVWVIETRDDQDRLVARGQVRLQNLN
jgi:1,4-dihydroxy-2-naphthoyl-CoA hydrolase